MKKLFSGLVVLAMTAAMAVPTFAAVTNDGGEGPVPIKLTTEAPAFSVTVPTVLPINVSAAGVNTYADNVKLVNNSKGPVKVSDLSITGKNMWETVDYQTDMASKPVNTKNIAVNVNGAKTTGSNAINFAGGSFQVMTGVDGTDNEAEITYDAKLPTQSTAISQQEVAEVVFTVTWNK